MDQLIRQTLTLKSGDIEYTVDATDVISLVPRDQRKEAIKAYLEERAHTFEAIGKDEQQGRDWARDADGTLYYFFFKSAE